MSGAVSASVGTGGEIGFIDLASTPASLTISEGMRRATSNAPTSASARSVTPRGGGKFYFEVESGGGGFIGVIPVGRDQTTSLGTGAGFCGVRPDNGQLFVDSTGLHTFNQTAATVGRRACLAFDLSARLMWARTDNGVWVNDGDPNTGLNGTSIAGAPGVMHAAIQPTSGGGAGAAHVFSLRRMHLIHPIPTGFVPWG